MEKSKDIVNGFPGVFSLFLFISFSFYYFYRDLCINMNNHQNAIFHQLDNFMKHSHYIS
ncbi:hypothetical protein BCLUESOX_1165 [bacterium endosymbiont of Bathymodiolus sp. 5 South]|nr:hypothetical protein [uncultured Gammaproteobacteria bacterium]SHN93884.1 hypothetical protein BCLUESOX_1165 [bacterium endosymbiont of Bathymodiolus sp. 5 South]VVH57649.1 hypothetical protein BSPCLSOX_1000 [uncultured Gammaproteobacteria bacterium]VVH63852.1 hypothetical protein BSPWISOX_296 [uncultured Gammaproteobacteria bacterium]